MSRRLALALVVLPALAGVAHADDPAPVGAPVESAPVETAPTVSAPAESAPAESATDTASHDTPGTAPAAAPSDMGDQGISAMIGAAAGGRTTPGGLVIAGHFYYQLSDQDWFDGSAAFTFGSSEPECFRDRMENVLCDHGLADGYSGAITAGVRRFLPAVASGGFWPFVSGGVGAAVVRFPPEDDTTGITFFLHAGAGLRASITEAIALTAQAQLHVGVGQFSNGVGGEPQLGLNITAGAEFKL